MEMFDDYPVRRGFSGLGWFLEDCEAAATQSLGTFKLPSRATRAKVQVGSLLRLHFVITDPEAMADPENPRAERMWVEVCEIINEDAILGHLTNMPAFIESLEPGDVIEFTWKHVAQADNPK